VRVASLFLPPRRRGVEHLDDPALDPALALRSLRDIRWSNRLFGGTDAVLRELRPILAAGRELGRPLTLLDVGTGAGDVPAAARALAREMGVTLVTFGLEWTRRIADAASRAAGPSVAADARHLPIATQSVDVVTCSQLLHHFDDADGQALIGELHRVACRAVVVGELRRSWLAAAGIWIASWPLGFHPVSRHDGVVSVFRGFTSGELATAVTRAVGALPTVRHAPVFRLTATWSPT
jgi:SAM-dependent methyltransferase